MLAMEGVAKSPEKKGTTKDTKSTKEKKSSSLCSSCPSWFKAFMLFATTSLSAKEVVIGLDQKIMQTNAPA